MLLILLPWVLKNMFSANLKIIYSWIWLTLLIQELHIFEYFETMFLNIHYYAP